MFLRFNYTGVKGFKLTIFTDYQSYLIMLYLYINHFMMKIVIFTF
jgi:hypothetical protein